MKALKVGGVIGFTDCLSQLVDFVSCVAEKGLGGVQPSTRSYLVYRNTGRSLQSGETDGRHGLLFLFEKTAIKSERI